ncbi:MAG TPA: hypothetical protein VG816_00450 [Solirubrobacterales bacterium]|nr:hypothetical protein [Solirubrobacterales bacterium]
MLSLTGDCSTSSSDSVPDPGPCPGTPGTDHPPRAFDNPCGVAVDRYGDIYVASSALATETGTNGRIDVFSPQGDYLIGIKDEAQPCSLAVDSVGNLYAVEYANQGVVRFAPSSFPPAPGVTYSKSTVFEKVGATEGAWAVAVDPSDDHLFFTRQTRIMEYDSAADGLTPIREEIGLDEAETLTGIDVCGANHDVYATGTTITEHPGLPENARVFAFDGTTGVKKLELDGSNTPAGSFGFIFGNSGIAVDQANCDFYVDDTEGHKAVDQFHSDGSFVGQLPKPPALREPQPFADIAVDDPMTEGEVGYESPNGGYVFVTSGIFTTNPHLYAFAPTPEVSAPVVSGQVAAAITASSATLEAEVNPNASATAYAFEYVSEAEFQQNGYANAQRAPVPDGELAAGAFPVPVSAPVTGLTAGNRYRFRLTATNHCDPLEPADACTTTGEGLPGGVGEDAAFATYPPPRVGLPDGRAYELVTPPQTNGRIPTMAELGAGFNGFDTPLSSADGNSLLFGTEGGALPGIGGGGFHDTFEAVRGPGGWQSHFTGLSGAQAREPMEGGVSADHRLSFWEARGSQGSFAGSAALGTTYVRREAGAIDSACSPEPGGAFEAIGCGSLGTEPLAHGRWISGDGAHVIFETNTDNLAPAKQLEPNAPPTGTAAIYDRTADGTTHVVSLLPGEVQLKAGEGATYLGASADGTAVAFKVKGATYARLDDAETVPVTSGNAVFGGFSADGSRLVYLKEPIAGPGPTRGGIVVFDTASGESTSVGGTESVLVNVSDDGSHVFFVSPKKLDGKLGQLGKDNLYAWDGSAAHFIATLEPGDVDGREGNAGGARVEGLGLWVSDAVGPSPGPYSGPAVDPSRSTPDGETFVFQSRAPLTGYANAGYSEIYRFDLAAPPGGQLTCVSCNPTGSAATSDAQLESNTGPAFAAFPPVDALVHIANVTEDGSKVFFQSADRLVNGDTDRKIDVYEWRGEGTAGCEREAGCIDLISSGRSAGDDYLFAMTPSGSDVFFQSGDALLPQDTDSTPSIYDARVAGGFPQPPPPPPACEGDACQAATPGPPALPGAGGATSAVPQGEGNVHPHVRKKGKHKKKRKRHGGRRRGHRGGGAR